jgi:hypothetical protein
MPGGQQAPLFDGLLIAFAGLLIAADLGESLIM